ncbi:MAG: glucose-6-phosphate isomerase [Planctomycetes bacterium]|nr:glucose-6-phosphate isomerase [Planctomycetota bacterium]
MADIELKLDNSLPMTDVTSAIQQANDGIGIGDEIWRSLWQEPMRSAHISSVMELVKKLRPQCKNFLLLGIGGSALGARALHCALGDTSIPFFVLDNIDPCTVSQTIDAIKKNDPSFEQTVIAVISKSGETAEISSLLMVAQRQMQNATYVAITGKSGTLRDYAIEKQWATLPVPDGVGGRFSVLSPVGLFPAAMCGIDIVALLDGAKEMDDLCRQTTHNPAAELASGLVGAMKGGKPLQVMMVYCDRLVQFAHWYVQLWAESLGKIDKDGNRIGPTPIAAIGATDQHSMLQLWREGPADKVIGFVTVNETDQIPLGNTPISASQQWLCGQTLDSLLRAQHEATKQAVQDAGQATWTMKLQGINPNVIGQFIAIWQATVAIAGQILHVDPYNQPGVELGKQLTRKSLDNSSQ